LLQNLAILRETSNAWLLQVEKAEIRITKTDTQRRAFITMSDALKWSGAEAVSGDKP
jgi:hypothetical protein